MPVHRKPAFREAFKSGMLTKEQTEHALAMTDDRNLTSHTYIESVADKVYSRIAGHTGLMRIMVDKAFGEPE